MNALCSRLELKKRFKLKINIEETCTVSVLVGVPSSMVYTIASDRHKMEDLVMANHTNGSNNSTCFQFGESDVETITRVKIGLAAGGVFACTLAIIIIVAGKQFRQRFIYRLVGYLMFTAMLESITYILEEVPLQDRNNHVALRNGSAFEILCVGAGVFSQFAVWLEDIVVIWIVVYLFLLAVCNYVQRTEKKGNACSTREVCGVIISLAIAALFCWIPFVKDMYGFAGLWCWIKLTKEDCDSGYTLGLIYQ